MKSMKLILAGIAVGAATLAGIQMAGSKAYAYEPSDPPPLCTATDVGQVYMNTTETNILWDMVNRTGTGGGMTTTIKNQILDSLASNPTWIAGVKAPNGTTDPMDATLVVSIWDVGATTSSSTTGVSYGYWSSSETNPYFLRHEGNTPYPRITLRFYRDESITDKWVFKEHVGYPYAVVGDASDWTTPTYPTTGNGRTRIISNSSISQLYGSYDCLVGAWNIYRYPKDYATALPSGGLNETEDEGGGFWDSITGGIEDIVDFIQNMPELVAALFVPSPSSVTAITTEFTDFFEEKLGILLYPFEFTADVFNTLMGIGSSDAYDDYGNTYNTCATATVSSTNSAWSFGNYMGGNVGINPCAFQIAMPTIWTFATLAARALLVYAVINMLLHTHRRLVR